MPVLMKTHPIEVQIDGKFYYINKEKKKPVITLLLALGAVEKKKNLDSDNVLDEIYDGKPKGSVHLKGARTKENLSQKDLMNLTGIPVYNISKMENGRRPIGKDIAKRLAKALKIDYKLLLEK